MGGRGTQMITATLLPTAAFLRCACQLFTNAAGADGDVSHRLAQPEFLQGGKLRLCICTTNHSKTAVKKCVGVKKKDWFTQHYITLTSLDVLSLLRVRWDDSERCGAAKRKTQPCVSVVVSTRAAERRFSCIMIVQGRLTCYNRWLRAAAGGWQHAYVLDFKPWSLGKYLVFIPFNIFDKFYRIVDLRDGYNSEILSEGLYVTVYRRSLYENTRHLVTWQ